MLQNVVNIKETGAVALYIDKDVLYGMKSLILK